MLFPDFAVLVMTPALNNFFGNKSFAAVFHLLKQCGRKRENYITICTSTNRTKLISLVHNTLQLFIAWENTGFSFDLGISLMIATAPLVSEILWWETKTCIQTDGRFGAMMQVSIIELSSPICLDFSYLKFFSAGSFGEWWTCHNSARFW